MLFHFIDPVIRSPFTKNRVFVFDFDFWFVRSFFLCVEKYRNKIVLIELNTMILINGRL